MTAPPPELLALEQSYLDLAHRLNARGIRLIVVGYPQKGAIYPEFAPPDLPRTTPGGQYDQFVDSAQLELLPGEVAVGAGRLQGLHMCLVVVRVV